MRIVCDMDGVLCKLTEKIIDRWNKENGTNFTAEDATMWRLEEMFGKNKDGVPAEGLIDKWLAEPGFFEDVEPIEDAVKSLQLLMDRGHDVVIATSVPEVAVNAFDGKRKWMRKYFPKFSMKSFICVSRKGLIDGDVLIDDGEHNIADWTKHGKTGAFVFDQPWNSSFYDETTMHGVPITRVYTWKDLLAKIEEHATTQITRASF